MIIIMVYMFLWFTNPRSSRRSRNSRCAKAPVIGHGSQTGWGRGATAATADTINCNNSSCGEKSFKMLLFYISYIGGKKVLRNTHPLSTSTPIQKPPPHGHGVSGSKRPCSPTLQTHTERLDPWHAEAEAPPPPPWPWRCELGF